MAISIYMGYCNVPSYFLQATDMESVDTGLTGKPDLLKEENYENKCFLSKLRSH